MVTNACQWSSFWTSWTHIIFLSRSALITSFYLRLGLPSGQFHFDYPIKSMYTFLHYIYMSRANHPPWFHHPINIRWRVHIMKLLAVQSEPAFCYFSPLSSVCSPLHPVPNLRFSERWLWRALHLLRYEVVQSNCTCPSHQTVFLSIHVIQFSWEIEVSQPYKITGKIPTVCLHSNL
jgi:hypothetical protein